MKTAPIFARLIRAARSAGRELGIVSDQAISVGTVNDFRGDFFMLNRRVSPQQVRFTLEGAAMGNFALQWDLFALMEDSWPRLAKNLAELRRAAARSTYAAQPFSDRGAKPTASATERAALVQQSMKQWWPRPGTLELSFEDTLFHALDAYGKGISVLEVQWQSTADGIMPRCSHVLSSRRYGWNADGSELGLITAPGSYLPMTTPNASSTWQPFPQDHFLVGMWQARTGAPGATAVLRALAPYWVGITFGWEWLLSTAQIFGVPFRWATFDKNHPELGGQLRDMLAAMGASGYAAFPDGTKIEFKEAVTNARENPQVLIQELADKACDLLILGQELSGGAQRAGLGSGASNLQEAVRADRLQATAQWCADLLNYQLVPAVLRANYGDTSEPPTIVPDVDEEPDPLKLAQRDNVLLSAGVDLPRTWFYERHSIPEPLEGEPVIGGRVAAPAPVAGDPAAPAGGQGEAPEPGDNEMPDMEDDSPMAAKSRETAFKRVAGVLRRAMSPKSRQSRVQGVCKAIAAKSSTGVSASFDETALRQIAFARSKELGPLLSKVEAALAIEDASQRAAALRDLQKALPAEMRRLSPDSPLSTVLTNATSTAAVAGAAAATAKA